MIPTIATGKHLALHTLINEVLHVVSTLLALSIPVRRPPICMFALVVVAEIGGGLIDLYSPGDTWLWGVAVNDLVGASHQSILVPLCAGTLLPWDSADVASDRVSKASHHRGEEDSPELCSTATPKSYLVKSQTAGETR